MADVTVKVVEVRVLLNADAHTRDELTAAVKRCLFGKESLAVDAVVLDTGLPVDVTAGVPDDEWEGDGLDAADMDDVMYAYCARGGVE